MNLSLKRFLPLAGASGKKCAASDELILGQKLILAAQEWGGEGRGDSALRQAVCVQHVAELIGCLLYVKYRAWSIEGAPKRREREEWIFLHLVQCGQQAKVKTALGL